MLLVQLSTENLKFLHFLQLAKAKVLLKDRKPCSEHTITLL